MYLKLIVPGKSKILYKKRSAKLVGFILFYYSNSRVYVSLFL